MSKKIAIIGSGISGLTCAYLLHKKHDITLFEQAERLGGHTATIDVDYQGEQLAIDTGFIVYNDRTYPNFIKLLSQLGIQGQATEMSFSVHNEQTGTEYNGHSLNSLFAQRRNLIKPRFYKLINEILRFNKLCKSRFSQQQFEQDETLGSFLTEHNFSQYFAEHYVLPMGAAIWSTSLTEMKAFDLAFFIGFFHHHGLLNISDRPQWYVIPGGSKQYIAPLIKNFSDNIQLNCNIKQIKRTEQGVVLTFADNSEQVFDDVVLACHSNQALALLADASEDEQQILGAIPYVDNEVVLHTDINLLPKRKLAWASWNYRLTDNHSRPAAVTYNMNILQGLQAKHTYCVSLNQTEQIDANKIIGKFNYAHPVLNQHSQKAQQLRGSICGKNHTHFAGAYWYNGFHEDGVKSALDVAKRFACTLDD